MSVMGVRELTGVIFIVFMCCIDSRNTDCQSSCPASQNASADLHFVYGAWLVTRVEPMKYFFLNCCTDGGGSNVSVSWLKWNTSRQGWYGWAADGNIHPCSNGRGLAFEKPGPMDSGQFSCTASNGRHTIHRTFNVTIVDCQEESNVTYTTPDHQGAALGSRYSVQCAGDFGCGGARRDDNLVWWSVKDKTGNSSRLEPGQHHRYSVHLTHSSDQTSKAAGLTIEEVKEEDFRRVFTCSLKMGQHPTVGFNLSLTQTDPESRVEHFLPLIMAMGSLLVITTVAVIAVFLTCRPLVCFWWRKTVNTLPQRGERHYDVMVWRTVGEVGEGGEEEELLEKVETIRRRLTEAGYRLFQPRPGTPETASINGIADSVTVIFVVTEPHTASLAGASLEEQLPGLPLSVCADQRVRMVFVAVQGVQWRRLETAYRHFSASIPHLCTVAHWAGTGLPARNFWATVQGQLPRPLPHPQV